MADVFISYHTKTASGVAKAIADNLERHGVSCWYAPRDVTVGAYAASIIEAIDNCKVFLLILNEPATRSEHVLSELNAAFGRFNRHEGIAILPVRIDNCSFSKEMRYYLGPIHIKDFSSADGVPVDKITEIVSDILKTFAAQSGEESAPAQTLPAQAEGTDEPERKKSPEEEEKERVYREWKTEQRRKQEAQRRKAERKRQRRFGAVFLCVLIAIVGFAWERGLVPEPFTDIPDGQRTEQQLPDEESPSQEEASPEIQEGSQQESAQEETGEDSQEETQEDLPENSQVYYQGNQIPVYDLPRRQVNAGDFVWDGDRLSYVGSQFDVSFGVDVCSYQNHARTNGTLNWEAAKADGVEFAFVRIGFRGSFTGILQEDTYYDRNIDGAMSAGLTTGVYLLSMAVNTEEALEEADFVLERLKKLSINGPVVYDWEMNATSYRTYGVSRETATLCAKAFCERVKEAGYTPMIYMPEYVGYVKYDLSEFPYMMWYPQYPAESAAEPYPNFLYQMDVWQFGDSVEVDGIGTTYANLWFRPKTSGGED